MALRDTATVRGSHVGFHKGVEAAKKKKKWVFDFPHICNGMLVVGQLWSE